MKKKLTILLTSFFILSLESCSSSDKITPFRNENIDSFVYLTKEEFNDVYKAEFDKIIFVGSSSCSTCADSAKYINNYISSSHVLFFLVDNNIYKEVTNDNETDNSTILISKGTATKEILPYSPSVYSSQYNFNAFISKYVNAKSDKYIYNDFKKYTYSSYFKTLKFDFSSSLSYKEAQNNDNKTNIDILTDISEINAQTHIFWDKEKCLE